MLCKNCGNPVDENSKVCASCGIKEEAPVKVKKKRIWLGVLCVVLSLAIVLTTAAFFFKDNVKGFIVATKAPEEQLLYTYSRFAEKFGNSLADSYALSLENKDVPLSGEVILGLELSSDILSKIGFPAKELGKISLAYSFNTDGNKLFGMDYDLKLGDTQIVSAEVYFDYAKQEMVVSVPEVFDKSLRFDISEVFAQNEAVFNALSEVDVYKFLPSEDLVRNILPNLVDAAFATLDNVEQGKAEFTADNVTQTASYLETKFTVDVLADFFIGALEELKANQEVKLYIDRLEASLIEYSDTLEIESSDVEDLYDNMVGSIDDVIDEMEKTDDDTELFTLKTWVDGKFDVIAFEVRVPNTCSVFTGVAVDGKNIGYELEIEADNQTTLHITGAATREKSKINGSLDVFVQDVHVGTIKIENLDALPLKNGSINGTFILSPSSELNKSISASTGLKDLSLAITVQSSKNAYSYEMSLFEKDSVLAKLTTDASISDGGAIIIPSDTTTNVESWVSSADINVILDRLKEAGISQDIISALM